MSAKIGFLSGIASDRNNNKKSTAMTSNVHRIHEIKSKNGLTIFIATKWFVSQSIHGAYKLACKYLTSGFSM